MFFADKPYVSEFFKKTIMENNIPVVGTDGAKTLRLLSGTNIIHKDRAVELAENSDILRAYTTSENSIGWIISNLSNTDLPGKINQFKDKLKFRELTRNIFPDFYFQGVQVTELESVRIEEIPLPFIIKPSVGFFSMGVYKVTDQQEWPKVIDAIQAEIERVRDIYPREVMDADRFVIEECINGDEFAVDAYFDSQGEPVVLSIYKHIFSSDDDVGDRVYTTSKIIIQNNLSDFTAFARRVGKATGIKNFPVHMELRRQKNGNILPIEINPLRFGGWCTTADMTFLAWGFNPYLYYYQGQRPDWDEILKKRADKLFSIIVLDNSTGINAENILSFNYDRLLAGFEKPLELRKIEFTSYPVFGFLFVETRKENFQEIEYILNSDLREFVEIE